MFCFDPLGANCPPGTVYQQCGQVCPQTCDTIESIDCIDGCIDGCFCPSGQVMWNEDCINASECESTYSNYVYLLLH